MVAWMRQDPRDSKIHVLIPVPPAASADVLKGDGKQDQPRFTLGLRLESWLSDTYQRTVDCVCFAWPPILMTQVTRRRSWYLLLPS
ncbi:protein MIS12 homolog isoform X2 [Phocoena sinus]|uniref:protein MIS12 homolog isoform X2 n=1 Tax=Phocoena sinus TaxID=42100 RepID=UPI0013C4E203|nr:protein MIS12 homolog isoform X2 [Phocoena sinus]